MMGRGKKSEDPSRVEKRRTDERQLDEQPVFDKWRDACRSRIVVELDSARRADFADLINEVFDEEYYPGRADSRVDRYKDLLPWEEMRKELKQFRFATLHRRMPEVERDVTSVDGLGDITAAELDALYAEAEPVLRKLYEEADPVLRERFGERLIPDLRSFFSIDVPQSTDRGALRDFARFLRDKDSPRRRRRFDPTGRVVDAYVEGRPELPAGTLLQLGEAEEQTYLRNGPFGVGAEYALGRNLVGADVRVADVEQGWMIKHEDLEGVPPPVWGISLNDDRIVEHGTAVLGILNANFDATGCIGIASGAEPILVSQWTRDGDYHTLAAIMQAIRRPVGNQVRLRAGDVLLIEAQTRVEENGPLVPIEVQSAARAAIILAYGLGITVIEAAGNGDVNLKDVKNHRDEPIFDPDLPFNIDSHAIMVGAGVSDNRAIGPTYTRWVGAVNPNRPLAKPPASNFGARVDCFAYGADVFTLASYTGDEVRYDNFPAGGTSAAAAMIAGVAAVIQGYANQRKPDAFYLPETMRTLLKNPVTGTGTRDAASQRIGVMPDLSKLIPVLPEPDGDRSNLPSPKGSNPQLKNAPRLVAPKLPPRTWANRA